MRKVVVLVAACLVLISHTAAADPVMYGFTGTMDDDPFHDPGDDALRTVVAGTTFSGSFWYELAPTPTGGTLGWGRGDLDMMHFGYSVIFDALDIDDGQRFQTISANPVGSGDILALHDEVPMTSLARQLVDEMLLTFRFEPGTFGSGLPGRLDPAAFLDGRLRLTVSDNPHFIYDQYGTIQSITQVPEPGTLLLFGLGLTMAATAARRGRQRFDSMRAPARGK